MGERVIHDLYLKIVELRTVKDTADILHTSFVDSARRVIREYPDASYSRKRRSCRSLYEGFEDPFQPRTAADRKHRQSGYMRLQWRGTGIWKSRKGATTRKRFNNVRSDNAQQ